MLTGFEVIIRPFVPTDLPGCERVLRSLPEWFGIEDANQQYLRDFAALETLVAERAGDVVGVITLKAHMPVAVEVWFLAVERSLHRQGVGRALLDHAESLLRERGVRLLQVKTLGASHPDAGYVKTRAFYGSAGYLPLEETTAFWGPEQPALILVKPLA